MYDKSQGMEGSFFVKNRQTAPMIIFRSVYRINNVRNEVAVLWCGRFASLYMNTRSRASIESMCVWNLTTKRKFALYIARKICRLKVSSQHFYDVISDNLDEFASSYETLSRTCSDT